MLFTADPVTCNRKVVSVEASFGLGEALVSGPVNPDVYKVRNAEIVGKTIAEKQLAFEALPSGGTQERAIDERQQQPALTEIQVIRLAQLGRQIEAHFGRPQDIEWCLVDDDFLIVQSRPITTLFPIPVVADGENHVYVSTGDQQMMTDAIKPLGISVWQLTAAAPMHEAGGRIFVDVSRALASPAGRASLFATLGKSDPLIRDALQTIIDHDFIPLVPGAPDAGPPVVVVRPDRDRPCDRRRADRARSGVDRASPRGDPREIRHGGIRLHRDGHARAGSVSRSTRRSMQVITAGNGILVVAQRSP